MRPFWRREVRSEHGAAAVQTQRGRVLVVCHVSATGHAVELVRALCPACESVDVLPYGQSHEELPAPPGSCIVALPAVRSSPRALVGVSRWLWNLRSRHYGLAVVAQPSLGLSRARGLLVAFPFVAGAGQVVILDPRVGEVRRVVSVGFALTDLVRWISLRIVSAVLGLLATALIRRLDRTEPGPARSAQAAGRVVYLRTDIDLAVSPLEAGGSLAHTVGIVGGLLDRGHPVELWSTGPIADVPSAAVERRLPATLRGNVPTEIAELLSGLRQVLRPPTRCRSEAFVYQRYSLNNLAGLALARRWDVPLILEANSSEAKWRTEWSAIRYPGLAAATERFLLRRADRISVVSDNAARDIMAGGAPPDRLRVVPNGVEAERFADAKPARLPFPSGAFVVAFVGLFYPWHGVRYLAEAFSKLYAAHSDARLLLVGDGEDAQYVRAVLDHGRCRSATHMPGLVARSAVPGYIAAADVVVSPHAAGRDFIGSPIKLFEYMASGRAIVASEVAQISEVLRDGETALLVPPESPDALLQALARLREDGELRARLGRNARAEALRSHTWRARLDSILAPDRQ